MITDNEVERMLSLCDVTQIDYIRIDLAEDHRLVITPIDASIRNGDRIYCWHKELALIHEYVMYDREYVMTISDCHSYNEFINICKCMGMI